MTAGKTPLKVHQGWERWQGPLLIVSIAVMVLLATPWLGYQFWRLLWQPVELAGRPVHPGAIDLIDRFHEIRLWLSGQRVPNFVYPPASYLMLWPLLGWLPLQWAIKLWAAASIAAMGWLSAIAVRESGVEGRTARVFVALLPLAGYATGATIGNGQVNLLVLPMLVAGIVSLRRGPASWPRDLGASLLVLASLVKPSFSAPFFWIVALAIGRLRPAVLICLGYVLLAVAASPFNPGGPLQQHYDWVSYGSEAAFYSSAVVGTPAGAETWASQLSINGIQRVLTLVGLQRWTFVASLFVLIALGVWVYRHRRADVWLLLGVSAIASRFWTYHRWYDDVVMLLPMLALFRILRSEPPAQRALGSWLLFSAIITSLAPGGLFLLPPPWDGWYVMVQLAVWLMMLGYLLSFGRRRE